MRALTASRGSTLFALTWKERVTPSARRICALRGSVLRTSDNGFSSWPSPTVDRATYTYRNGNRDEKCLTLHGTASLAGWPTPQANEPDSRERPSREATGRKSEYLGRTARLAAWPTPKSQDAERGGSESHEDGRRSNLIDKAQLGGTPEQQRKRKAQEKGLSLGDSVTSLNLQAQLASWATPASPKQPLRAPPAARDWRDGRASDETMDKNARPLNEQAVHLAVLPAASGETPSGSSAETESIGQLNPAHSRWLQGFPPAWDACAGTATRSCRKSRRRS